MADSKPDLFAIYSTARLDSDQMGNAVDNMVQRTKESRRSFERRWYDNNWFDDGFHFRYLSREQNKIVDLADRTTLYSPLRTIPKASRQIRGIANILLSTDPLAVVYPENVSPSQYPPITVMDPLTKQPIQQPNPLLLQAQDAAKQLAKKSGHWLTEEFKTQDLTEKLAQMVILAAKHGVSYLQIWPDAIQEKIKTQVFDAFDIFVSGVVTELEDSPYLIKGTSRTIAEIKADPRFDPEKVARVSADNRFSNSEIKDAYMRARYGGITKPDTAATILEKEAFIKEYISEENLPRIKAQKNGKDILDGRNTGDIVIRHSFVEGNITVLDEYLDLDAYPIVDFRFEPGPIYQVPLIERFIHANKSLDIIASRVERYINLMVTGSWSKRKGEDFEISNASGGQVIEFAAQPPIQNQIAPVPNFVFNFMDTLTSYIEEQGVTVTTLGKLPKGVKANAAIESLKEGENANLVISIRRLKNTVKRIAERFLDLADRYFVTPQTVMMLDKGEPSYFDIIGHSALQKRRQLKIDTPDHVIPLKGDYRVEIEVEDQLAYTHEGQKAAAQELSQLLIQLAPLGLVSPEVVKAFITKMLDIYRFGDTSEILDAMDQALAQGQLTQDQMAAMKAAMSQVLVDHQKAGMFPTPEQRMQEGGASTAQALGQIHGAQQGPPAPTQGGPVQGGGQ